MIEDATSTYTYIQMHSLSQRGPVSDRFFLSQEKHPKLDVMAAALAGWMACAAYIGDREESGDTG